MSAIARFCDDFERPRGPRLRTRAKPLDRVVVAVDDARRRATTGEWDGAKGMTFVGLYALCHEMVYGIVPEELYIDRLMKAASRMAAQMLHQHFQDDANAMAEFVRWAWDREKRKHTWASSNGIDRNRLGWKWQFALGLLTDYRIACRQKRR